VTCVDTVRRGDTFGTLLLRNRLYLRDIERVIREVQRSELFSLRRLRPGETVAVSLDLDGRLQRLAYQKSPDQVYVLEAAPGSLRTYVTGLDYHTYYRKIAGQVCTTLDEAIRNGGGDPALVMELATAFASDIDFLTEPRKGDEVTLLVQEKRYRGERVGACEIYFADYRGQCVRQTAIRFPPAAQEGAGGAYFTPDGESLLRTFLRSPLNYRRISSHFSRRRFHPILRRWRPHLGVDYAAPMGTPVVSVGAGVVTRAGWNGGFGRYVEIRHDHLYVTSYGHLSRIARGLKRGTRVKRGQVIGLVGSSGLSTGPHLDFRVKRGDRFIDPLRMDNPPAKPIPEALRAAFDAHVARLAALVDTVAPGDLVPAEDGDGDAAPGRQHAALRGAPGKLDSAWMR
jgi:murein DD-endopeptidase MepM/ murein hydrolase activator NlpD